MSCDQLFGLFLIVIGIVSAVSGWNDHLKWKKSVDARLKALEDLPGKWLMSKDDRR